MILFANVIQSIGEQLKLRQQVIATATGGLAPFIYPLCILLFYFSILSTILYSKLFELV